MRSGGFVHCIGRFFLRLLPLFALYFSVEAVPFLLIGAGSVFPLAFGAVWALMLASLCLALPRKAGRIVFGVSYYLFLLWSLAQVGYYQVFGKLMWFSTVGYAGEGAVFLGDVLLKFPPLWWILGILLLAAGGFALRFYPRRDCRWLPHAATGALCLVFLCFLPELVFLRDNHVWGTRSEFGQSSSYRSTYSTMYDAKSVYDICGIYQLALRDLWKHNIYPLTPDYRRTVQTQREKVDEYFAQRAPHADNDMTGIFAGKNVVLVLMESMDDWLITPEDTPTIHRMMEEGIQFSDFYTPGYGSARTFNSEFAMNTGIYLPTTGNFVFHYVTNDFDQSIANQLKDAGYSGKVFHYNNPEFYSRGVFEPAMGYEEYVCYEDYDDDSDHLFDDCLLFDNADLSDLFFREGRTFNTIITRSAHLSYTYNEVLSHYALKKYPEYRGKYASQEEDCARVKAKLVDDLFARLLLELEKNGQLENTVIIAMTDHYTYGYKNMDELYAHSGVETEMELEKTPCFIWASNAPALLVEKTACTVDLVPTVMNLLGLDTPYSYLGQDVFDPNYPGYAIFPDGSFVWQGVMCRQSDGAYEVIRNEHGITTDDAFYQRVSQTAQAFIEANNLLLTCDYYKETK